MKNPVKPKSYCDLKRDLAEMTESKKSEVKLLQDEIAKLQEQALSAAHEESEELAKLKKELHEVKEQKVSEMKENEKLKSEKTRQDEKLRIFSRKNGEMKEQLSKIQETHEEKLRNQMNDSKQKELRLYEVNEALQVGFLTINRLLIEFNLFQDFTIRLEQDCYKKKTLSP